MSQTAPSTDFAPFDLTGPLPSGVIVLEASAGTGKTFTIAALAARFVAEGVPLDDLLLVTFTRAATSELRERVRGRLVSTERELARVIAGAQPLSDDAVVALLASGPATQVQARRERLTRAIADFDAATIETTHGFCQKMLAELGTLGDLEPDVEFVDNIDELITEVVDDLYVRLFSVPRSVAPIDRAQADQVARIAIENPTADVHPISPPERSVEALRKWFAVQARDELEARKRAMALMTHNDQLTRLLTVLAGPHGELAVGRLRERFAVVLIDEFQDTDPVQWEIVARAFGDGGTTLVLIGDPKQAIYAFRGADVYAYLAALNAADRRATLAVNHRSDEPLLRGLDALFGPARLGHPDIPYRRVAAAAGNATSRLRGAPCDSALRVRVVPDDDPSLAIGASGLPSSASARECISRDLAADIARLLSSEATLLSSEATLEPRAGELNRVARQIAPGDIAVLVRTHDQADLIRERLDELDVPAVITGAGSVFETPAAEDWRVFLEALERPSDQRRARAAALTAFIGWQVARVADADERELEALHMRLHRWARLLRERGVAALTEAVLRRSQVPGRLLAQLDGERHLTDLRHISQLLHAQAGGGQLGIAALSGWLRERIADAARERGHDELTRRLDTDAAAVQVLTIHGSKGLEFPVVYCPFLWDGRKYELPTRPVYFHDRNNHDRRAVDVTLSGPEFREHAERYLEEERGEDLRLAYVALTRARHQVVLWWASSYYATESALGRLLFSMDADGNVATKAGPARPGALAAAARLREIQGLAPEAISVEDARIGSAEHWRGAPSVDLGLDVARFGRSLDLLWRRTSYTAITAAAHDAAFVGSEPEELGVIDEPAGPLEGAAALTSAAGGQVLGLTTRSSALTERALPLATMATGPRVGTAVHSALERVEFDADDLTAAVGEALSATLSGNGSLLGCPTSVAAEGLALALSTPLGGGVGTRALSSVAAADRLNELEFELPLAGGESPSGLVGTRQIAALLRDRLPADDPLSGYAARLEDPSLASVVRGYLTGLIDLVWRVESPGRRPCYVIVDYKTNWLAPAEEPLSSWHYRPAALAAEMQRSHYVLQALLYAVALHRYLRWRLTDYDPETDLGGVYYLFIRGMSGPDTPEVDGGRCGVFEWHPPAGLIVALSEVLSGD